MELSPKTQIAKAALEKMAFQANRELFTRMTEVFERIYIVPRKKRTKKVMEEFQTELNTHIKDITGINADMRVGHYDDTFAHTYTGMLIYDHTLNIPMEREITEYYNKGITGLGTINPTTMKVTGIFSKIEVLIAFSLYYAGELDLTPAECSAVICHEIGHTFTYLLLLNDNLHMSHAMRDTIPSIINENNVTIKTDLCKKAAKEYGLKQSDLDPIIATNKPEIAAPVFINAWNNRTLSGSNSGLYDLRTWESMSDDFAIKCGAAYELATALHKLNVMQGDLRQPGAVENILHAIWHVALVLLAGIVGSAFFGVVTLGFIWFLMRFGGPYAEIYDTPVERILKIRTGLVAELKSSKDSERKQVNTKRIAELDEMLSVYKAGDDVANLYWWIFSSKYRGDRKEMEIAKIIEQLTDNDLFISGAKLSQLAKNARK